MHVTCIYFEEPPTGVMAEAVGADEIHVTWELPPDHVCRSGFTVSYTSERKRETLSTGVGPSASDSPIPGLHCNTAYIVTVGTVAHKDASVAQSEEVRVLVGGDYSTSLCHIAINCWLPLLISCPPGPRNFSAAVVSPTSVHLTWKPPASPCNESITGYEITYTYSKCGTNGSSLARNLMGVEYTFDHPVEEDTEYCFRLRAVGKDFTDPVSVRTLTDG